MIPTDRSDILDEALEVLADFGPRVDVRGRFVGLYLGLRRMTVVGNVLAQLGEGRATPASEIEQFLDRLYRKSHRDSPFVVLTAPFGGSFSQDAPYSALSGAAAPGRVYPTNTWRNNFGIQKGVGCVADSGVITGLLDHPQHRLGCPHMTRPQEGVYRCSIGATDYRGEDHAIWLRRVNGGYQVVDLNHPAVYRDYLRPSGQLIPVFPLIAMLYCMALPGVYPDRAVVGIPQFADDFGFAPDEVGALFDCDPESAPNSAIHSVVNDSAGILSTTSGSGDPDAANLPDDPPDSVLNTGVGAEILVARDLQSSGWEVRYRANQPLLGYDLEATREGQTLRVEVKSSVSYANLELQESEWAAARTYGESYVLAVVDFYGSTSPSIWYVRDPAANAEPIQSAAVTYRFVRAQVDPIKTDAEFL